MGNERNAHTSKLDKYTVLDAVFKLDWKKRKDKHYMVVKIISMFRTAVHFFPTCQALKAWFKLSRVNLYRNDLKGNENYFKLTGPRLELSRVRVTEGKIIVDVRRKSSGNRFWFAFNSARFELARVAVSVLFADNSRYPCFCISQRIVTSSFLLTVSDMCSNHFFCTSIFVMLTRLPLDICSSLIAPLSVVGFCKFETTTYNMIYRFLLHVTYPA